MSNSMSSEHELQTIERQYREWRSMSKIELKEKSKGNVEQRLRIIEKTVNTIISNTLPMLQQAQCFSISEQDELAIFGAIEKEINSWNGVQIQACQDRQKKDFTSYFTTALNWFNRNKAKIYGNHLFYHLVFHHILKFCWELTNVIDRQKTMVFIDIFEGIMSEPVQFPRTKLQPLLPHQALMQPNAFKKACEQFALYYNIKWISSIENKPDKGRAKKIHESFMSCLTHIKNELMTSNNTRPIPFPFDVATKERSIIPNLYHAYSHSTENTENTDNIPPRVYDNGDIQIPYDNDYDDIQIPFDNDYDDIQMPYHQDYDDNKNMLCIDDGMQRLFSIQSPHDPTPYYNGNYHEHCLDCVHTSPVMDQTHQVNANQPYHQPYQASRYSPIGHVSQRRYSPMSCPIPTVGTHTPTPTATTTDDGGYTPFNTLYPFNTTPYDNDYFDHQMDDNYSNYGDDSFVFTNLSHNFRSPTPLFDGFL